MPSLAPFSQLKEPLKKSIKCISYKSDSVVVNWQIRNTKKSKGGGHKKSSTVSSLIVYLNCPFTTEFNIPSDGGTSPEVIISVSFQHVQEEISGWRAIHGNHFHAFSAAGWLSSTPWVLCGKSIFPLYPIPFSVVLNIGFGITFASIGWSSYRFWGGGRGGNWGWGRGGSRSSLTKNWKMTKWLDTIYNGILTISLKKTTKCGLKSILFWISSYKEIGLT